MRLKAMPSKYDGKCGSCKAAYVKGDLIYWSPETGAVCALCGATKSKEAIVAQYICGKCGQKGHNRRTCPSLTDKAGYVDPNKTRVLLDVEQPPQSKQEEKPKTVKIRKADCWKLAESVIQESRLVLLYGPPGTGKTTAANFCGNPKEVFNVTITEDMPSAELRGHYIPVGGEFEFRLGPALLPFTRGSRLVVNEIDKASGDVLSFFHALLDDPGISRFTLPTGETLEPHPDFTVVATMNGIPHDLPQALRDRFAVKVNIDKLHPEAVRALPEDLREAAQNGISFDEERSVSMRGWKAFAQLREAIGEKEAAQAVFGANAETILNTVKIGSTKFSTFTADPDGEDIPFEAA